MLARLKRNNYPDCQFDKAYPNHVEKDSEKYTIFNFVHEDYDLLHPSLPLHVDVAREKPHEIGACSDVGLVVKLVHKFGLWRHFWIRDRVSPVVDQDHHKGCDHRAQKQGQRYQPAQLPAFGVTPEHKGRDHE